MRNPIQPLRFALMLALAVIVVSAGVAFAQQESDPAHQRDRDQIQNPSGDQQGDALRDRIQDRIHDDDSLTDRDRTRLMKHLRDCDELGVTDEMLAVLFNENEPLQNQIRQQERVMRMLREGLPVEPVMQKLQEGRRKGVDNATIERACEKMETHVRAAARVMKHAYEDGVTPGDEDAKQTRTREMARNMWQGLSEDEADALRERARLRLRDGSCDSEDLTVAAETAVKLREFGVTRERSVEFAGDALENGYRAQDMRQLRWAIMTAHMNGTENEAFLGALENGMRNRHELKQLVQEMWQHGWMGPADEHGGHGANSPGDHTTGGGGQGDRGGMGGSGGHNGGGNGGSGGSGNGKR